jgi:WD40 repeat protein/serine/threonine protein kinase
MLSLFPEFSYVVSDGSSGTAIMGNKATCLKCGAPLTGDARGGFCPKCLFAQASTDFNEASAASQTAPPNLAAWESNPTDAASTSTATGLPLPRAFGEYELLEEIARGGMGIVYRARQVSLHRIVAVKMLLSGPLSSPEFVKRFRAEASVAASLQHPNIVAIHEVGVHEGQQFFAMDYVEGQSVAKLLSNGPLPARRAAGYLKHIAEAIHYAHERGILHRDLKPSNVLIDASDQPRVTDFGLARRLEGDSELTITGQVLGSPNYMPPEQATGKRGKVSRRSDVYSLGAMLYHLLTGRPPFVGEALTDTLEQVLNAEPVSPRLLNPSVPRDLETICLKCLEKEADKRYAAAQVLADELGRFLQSEPVYARPVTRIERAWRWCRRKPVLASFVAATALLLLGILIGSPIFAYRINQARKAEQVQLQRAEAGEVTARQNQYATDMFRAHAALNEGDLFSALRLLDRNRPTPNQLGSSRRVEAHSLKQASQSRVTAAATDLRGWEWRYLWQQCQGDQLFILGYHSNGVTAVGFLPDGRTAYSAGRDKAVRLWDVESRQQIGLLAHDYPVTTAACSPDGRWLATSTSRWLATSTKDQDPRRALRLWDLATQRETPILTTNFWFRPNSTVFSPDSQLIAFVDVESGVHVWSVATRQEVANIPARYRIVSSLGLAFSPNGQTLAYNENEAGDIALWDIPRRQTRERRLKGHSWYVPSLAFTPDGRTLVSGGMDRSIRLWDVAEGRERAAFTNYPLGVAGVRLSPDGKTLAISATVGYQQITLQDTVTGTIISQLRGHHGPLSGAEFSPDGRTLISGSQDGSVRVWDVTAHPKEPECRPFQTAVGELSDGTGAALLLSPAGRHLLTVFTDKTFSVCEVPSLTESPHHPLPLSTFSCAAMAPDGKLAAFVAKDGNVVFWHTDSGQTNWFARPVTNAANRAVFSSDGTRLAIAGRREVCIMDVANKTKLHSFPFDKDIDVKSLVFSRDGQRLVAGFDTGLVKVWELAGHRQEVTLDGHKEQVRGLALLPDGRTLVSAARDICFWDLKSQRQLSVFQLRTAGLFGCSVSPDARRLAIGAGDRRITIWDLASGQEVATLQGHENYVVDVSFLSDGNTLVSVGVDQLRVWRAPSFAEIALAEKPKPRRE